MSQASPFEDRQTDETPADSLDVYHDASTPSATVDEFLEENNLGLGYYTSDAELYDQIERFHHGMFGRAAFSRKIVRRAIAETQRELALRGKAFFDENDMDVKHFDGWQDLDESERAEKSRREYVKRQGAHIWSRLSEEDKREALANVAGIDREWTPPHLRILMAEHEMTRSRDARLLDNLFGRIEELVTREDDDSGGGLLGGGS